MKKLNTCFWKSFKIVNIKTNSFAEMSAAEMQKVDGGTTMRAFLPNSVPLFPTKAVKIFVPTGAGIIWYFFK